MSIKVIINLPFQNEERNFLYSFFFTVLYYSLLQLIMKIRFESISLKPSARF